MVILGQVEVFASIDVFAMAGFTYGVYSWFEVVPFIFSGLIIMMFITALVLAWCHNKWWKRPKVTQIRRCTGKWYSYHAWAKWSRSVLRQIGEAWLRLVLKQEFKRVENKVTLKGYVFPKWHVYSISLMPVTVIIFTFITFWYVCFLRTSYTCEPNVDCFLVNAAWTDQPLNCSEILNNGISDTDIICYNFVFEIAMAVGAVGGVITISTLTMGLSLKITMNVASRLKFFGRMLLLFTVIIILQLMFPTALFLIAEHLDQGDFRPAFGYISVIVIEIFITVTIFPWCRGIKRPENEATQDEEDNDEDDLWPPCFRVCFHSTVEQNKSASDNKSAPLLDTSCIYDILSFQTVGKDRLLVMLSNTFYHCQSADSRPGRRK